MINESQIKVGSKLSCTVLAIENLEIVGIKKPFIELEYYGNVVLDTILNCNSCTIKPYTVPRFDLISESLGETVVTTKQAMHLEITDNKFDVHAENPTNEHEIIAAISSGKDLLFTKTKLLNQQMQAKKDMSASYRETINVIKEEIEALIHKIDSLHSELKVKEIIK